MVVTVQYEKQLGGQQEYLRGRAPLTKHIDVGVESTNVQIGFSDIMPNPAQIKTISYLTARAVLFQSSFFLQSYRRTTRHLLSVHKFLVPAPFVCFTPLSLFLR